MRVAAKNNLPSALPLNKHPMNLFTAELLGTEFHRKHPKRLRFEPQYDGLTDQSFFHQSSNA